MAKRITRVDKAGSFYTTFIFQKDPVNGATESTELIMPINEADSFQTAINGATWAQINALYNLDGTTIIKQ